MKLNSKNCEKLNAALKKVNGRCEAHTFTAVQLWRIGQNLKEHLGKWFTLAEMQGISGSSTSGDRLPKAYKYPREVNCISWIVGAGGNLFITSIKKDVAWNAGGETVVNFTDEQKSAITRVAIDHAMKP